MSSLSSTGRATQKADESSTLDKVEDVGDTGTDDDSDYDPDKEELPDKLILSSPPVPRLHTIPIDVNAKRNLSKSAESNRNMLNSNFGIAADCKPTLNVPAAHISKSPLQQFVQNMNVKALPDMSKPAGTQFCSELLNIPLTQLTNVPSARYVSMPRTHFINVAGAQPMNSIENHAHAPQMVNMPGVHMINTPRNMLVNVTGSQMLHTPRTRLPNAPRPQLPNTQPQLLNISNGPQLVRMSGAQFANLPSGPRYIVTPSAHLSQKIRTQLSNLPGNRFNNPTGVQLISTNTTRPQLHNTVGISYNNTPRFQLNNHFQAANIVDAQFNNLNRAQLPNSAGVQFNNTAMSVKQSTTKMKECLTRLVKTPTGTQTRGESSLSSYTPAQLQELFAANPTFLTQGIPNEMLAPSCSKVQQPTPSSMQISYNNKPSTSGTTRYVPVSGLQVGALQIPQTPDEDVDYEEIGVAETYATYMPSKLRMGCRHPDPVVETASLSSVDPIEPVYKLSLPNSVIMAGKLSSLQLEAIVYANQAHECRLPDGSRSGFFLGDGAGVGKGRTIAGIIYENFLKGRKRALWISVSNDLKYDAERDLRDIGAEFISVHSLNKFKYTKITTQDQQCRRGVIFCTYAALIGESNNSTGHYRSRFKQLLQWCGREFDGVIVFDECHKAKNLSLINASKSTKTGTTVLELQQKLPYARIVYASATGASEPRNMAYMVRLGLCGEGTAFVSFTEFLNAVELRGVGAMEIVAMDMKLRGMYIARQLSFKDVSFHIEEVPLSAEFRKIYNRSVDLWVDAMSKFTMASRLVGTDKRTYKVIWCQFWCAHQRFFKYLCIASKVNYAVKTARTAIKNGKCVVIGLQSTGESRTLDQLERDDGELNDFVSTAKNIFLAFVEKHFPAPERERYNHLRLTGDVLTSSESNVTGAQGPERGNAKSTRVTKRQRMGEIYSDLGFFYDYDSDLVDSDDEQDEEEDEDDNNEGDGEVEDDDFGTPSLVGSDSDDDDDSTLSPLHEFLAKPEAALKRPRGRPRKLNKVLKVEKLTVQDRVLELIQRKLGFARKEYVCQTDENGMPIHSTPNELKAKEQFEKEVETAIRLRENLIRSIERLGHQLPPNTLDHLIDELGGPDNVAEMTGRRGRVVQTSSGIIRYETRCEQETPMETINIIEKQRFMNGEKDVAIISEAASSGISLQSDRRCKNQRRRVHITMELPWSADRAVQQFGRTHRSNQVNAPEYIFLISDLAGERRFASTVAKRLESLGALTHGDRRATDTRDLSQFNIDNKYGRAALEAIMKAIAGDVSPIVPPPKDYKGANFFKDCAEALAGVGMLLHTDDFPEHYTLEKDYNNISKFLNRILGCHVDLQNSLFKYFNDTMNYIINQMKRTGKFDLGILDLGAHGEHVTPVGLVRFIRKHATGLAPTELHTLVVARGMTWYDAVNKYAALSKNYEGFYLTKHERDGKRGIVLAVEEEPTTKPTTQLFSANTDKTKEEIMLRVYRPNTGAQVRSESLHDIEERYTRCTSTEAKPYWLVQYTSSSDSCTHVYWTGQCSLSHECQVGLRDRVYHVLSGSVLPIWTRVERILTTHITNAKMQVIRLKTTSGRKIVGTMIPKQCFDTLIQNLREDSEKVEEYKY